MGDGVVLISSTQTRLQEIIEMARLVVAARSMVDSSNKSVSQIR